MEPIEGKSLALSGPAEGLTQPPDNREWSTYQHINELKLALKDNEITQLTQDSCALLIGHIPKCNPEEVKEIYSVCMQLYASFACLGTDWMLMSLTCMTAFSLIQNELQSRQTHLDQGYMRQAQQCLERANDCIGQLLNINQSFLNDGHLMFTENMRDRFSDFYLEFRSQPGAVPNLIQPTISHLVGKINMHNGIWNKDENLQPAANNVDSAPLDSIDPFAGDCLPSNAFMPIVFPQPYHAPVPDEDKKLIMNLLEQQDSAIRDGDMPLFSEVQIQLKVIEARLSAEGHPNALTLLRDPVSNIWNHLNFLEYIRRTPS